MQLPACIQLELATCQSCCRKPSPKQANARPQLLSRIIVSLIAKPYAVYAVRLCETIESHNLETIESETNIQGKRWILPVTDVKSC